MKILYLMPPDALESPAKLLRGIAHLYEKQPETHCVGTAYRDAVGQAHCDLGEATSCCIAGAMAIADPTCQQWPLRELAIDALRAEINPKAIGRWSDSTPLPEIIATLRRAADQLEHQKVA